MNRSWLLLFVVSLITAGGCSTADDTIEVIGGAPARVGTCHLAVDQAKDDGDETLVGVRYACGVEADALESEKWWGSQSPPLAFTMSPGDCLLLDRTYYCLEKVEHQRSGTFRPTYKVVGTDLLEALPRKP